MDGFGWEKGGKLEFKIIGKGQLNITPVNR
jgi:hypothetical protein